MVYLTIITTVLVLTQIIRVIQNSIQLSHIGEIEERNKLVMRVYEKIEEWIDRQEDT